MIVARLTQAECLDVLKASRLGRLACSRLNQPYVVPVYFVFADSHAYSFTMPGQKLAWMRLNPRVCLQVDEASHSGWRSVVALGNFEELHDRIGLKTERDRAWQLLSHNANWWEPGAVRPDPAALSDRSPHVFYRVRIDEVSGRSARNDR